MNVEDILTKHDGAVLTGMAVALGAIFYMVLRRLLKGTKPKWMGDRLWKSLSSYVLPFLVVTALFGIQALRRHIELEDRNELIMPFVSLALSWIAGIFIWKMTASKLGGWLVGAGCAAFSLMNSLAIGNSFRDALNNEIISVKLGETVISPYIVLKTVLTLVVFYMLAGSLARSVEAYLRRRREIKASNRNLLLQFFKIILYTGVGLFGLNLIGVDLTTLTVFGGALGVGLGFGLQKITSNFISGIILLLEQSVEEGDLIELTDGTLGFIRKNSARYTLVETFDSKEILVPNEDFITNRVTNWTYSNAKGRIEVHVGVSYKADVELARKLILEAGQSHPLCAEEPAPICYMAEFADSSVNFILHFWITDITIGRFKPIDEVLTKIWHAFKEHGVEIPFPQRDLYLKSMPSGTPPAPLDKA